MLWRRRGYRRNTPTLTGGAVQAAVVNLDELCDRVRAIGAVEPVEKRERAIRFDSEDEPRNVATGVYLAAGRSSVQPAVTCLNHSRSQTTRRTDTVVKSPAGLILKICPGGVTVSSC